MKVVDGRVKEPQARIPAYVLRSAEFAALIRLSPLAVHVLLILWSCDADGEAWCSQRRLARLAGTYRWSVVNAIHLLEDEGWIVRSRRDDPDDGRRIADNFRFLYPGQLEQSRIMINARMQGTGGAVPIPYFRDDDLFAGHVEIKQRRAIVGQSALASCEWARLRASGLTMHVYLMLLVYGPHHERVGGRRLAAECRMALPRVREALATLTGEADRWVSVQRKELDNGGTGTNWYLIEDRLFTASAALDDEAADDAARNAPVPDGPAPADLVGQLPGPQQEAIADGMSDAEVWALLRSARLWPRRETADQRATRMIREYHTFAQHADAATWTPTPAELEFARYLFRSYRSDVWELLRHVLAGIRAKWKPDSFAGLRAYCITSARALGLNRAAEPDK